MSGWNTVKLDSADTAFSLYVRTVAGWHCVRCARSATGQGLHCAHFHARRKESVRFDLENVDALCAGCHRYFTHHYTEHKEWKLQQLGEKKYDLLTLRANTSSTKDRKLQAMIWKQALKELQKDA